GRPVDQRKVGGRRFGDRFGHGRGRVKQTDPDREEGQVAPGRVLPVGAGQLVELGLALLLHCGAQRQQPRGELGFLNLLLQIEEVEVVGVEHGIDGDKVRAVAVAVALIEAVKLVFVGLHRDKAVFVQHRAGFLAPVGKLVGIGEVREIVGDGKGRHVRHKVGVVEGLHLAKQARQRRGRDNRRFGRRRRGGGGGGGRLRGGRCGGYRLRTAKKPGQQRAGQAEGKDTSFHPKDLLFVADSGINTTAGIPAGADRGKPRGGKDLRRYLKKASDKFR